MPPSHGTWQYKWKKNFWFQENLKFHDFSPFVYFPWLFQAWKNNFHFPWLFMTVGTLNITDPTFGNPFGLAENPGTYSYRGSCLIFWFWHRPNVRSLKANTHYVILRWPSPTKNRIDRAEPARDGDQFTSSDVRSCELIADSWGRTSLGHPTIMLRRLGLYRVAMIKTLRLGTNWPVGVYRRRISESRKLGQNYRIIMPIAFGPVGRWPLL